MSLGLLSQETCSRAKHVSCISFCSQGQLPPTPATTQNLGDIGCLLRRGSMGTGTSQLAIVYRDSSLLTLIRGHVSIQHGRGQGHPGGLRQMCGDGSWLAGGQRAGPRHRGCGRALPSRRPAPVLSQNLACGLKDRVLGSRTEKQDDGVM